MRSNPFADGLDFVLGRTGNHANLGDAIWIFVAFTIALIAASVMVAIAVWRRDPSQRNVWTVSAWLCRALIGAMWLEGSLWKLPLPGGLGYWLGLMGKNAAFDIYGGVINDFLVPHLMIVAAIIYASETLLAVSLLLGLFVRPLALLGVAMALNLWIGLYRYGPEWPWIYVFVAILHVQFLLFDAGRALGLDALRRPSARRATNW